jgi:hypothetical protein
MPVTWSDADDEVIAGDLAATLGYLTPAGGAVIAVVAPIGLRDREAGTVTFTTSLGFGKKLERMRANPRVALAYHARDGGFATDPRYVLVQGIATFDLAPDPELLENVIGPASTRFMGPPKRGRIFWDRWLQAYYSDRVLVSVAVERVTSWPDGTCTGAAQITGTPALADAPPIQTPPAKGKGPRINTSRAARRLRKLPHVFAAFKGADGFPVLAPVTVGEDDAQGIRLVAQNGLLPPGGRRAGVLGHRFNPKLIGLEARTHTGWLEGDESGGALYAPHTEAGFVAPANKTLLLLGNGFLARQGLKRARREAAAG